MQTPPIAPSLLWGDSSEFLFNVVFQQICRILESPADYDGNGEVPSKAEAIFKSLNQDTEVLSRSKERYNSYLVLATYGLVGIYW